MPIPPNLFAQATNTGVSPAARTKLRKLMTDELTVNPAFQAAEEQGFSLAGNQPIGGGGAAGMGSALLAPPPPNDPAAVQVKRPGFYDTVGGQMVKDLLEKRKNLSWAAPDFMANRNERDINTGLRLAGAEMGGVEGQAVAAQASADRMEQKLANEAKQARWEAEMTAAEEKRRAEIKKLEAETELARSRSMSSAADAAEGRGPRERYRSADGALYDTQSSKWMRPPPKEEPKSGSEPWEEAYQKALPTLMKPDSVTGEALSEEDLLEARERYRRLLGPARANVAPAAGTESTRVFRRGKNGQLERVR